MISSGFVSKRIRRFLRTLCALLEVVAAAVTCGFVSKRIHRRFAADAVAAVAGVVAFVSGYGR